MAAAWTNTSSGDQVGEDAVGGLHGRSHRVVEDRRDPDHGCRVGRVATATAQGKRRYPQIHPFGCERERSERRVVVVGRAGRRANGSRRGPPFVRGRPPATPTAGSPRPGTGTRRPAAPGSPAARRTSCRAWPASRGRAGPAAGSRTPGGPPRRGRAGPTTLTDELETMRRSTSLAVCCAPIRMMPSERPRSAMSSSTSLIGLEPSRGAYLFSSSIIVNSSPPAPAASLRAVSAASTTPTTNRCARSGRLCRSTTVTWLALGGHAPAGQSGRSPRTIVRSGFDDERSRRRNALIVPVPVTGPGPVAAGVLVEQPVGDELDQLVVGAQQPAVDRHRAVADRRWPRAAAGPRPGGSPSCTGCARPRRRRTT